MLPIQLFRQERTLIIEGLQKKNFKNLDIVDTIIAKDVEKRQIQVSCEQLANSLKTAAKSIGMHMGKGELAQAEALKAEVAKNKEQEKALNEQLNTLENELLRLQESLPNLPHSSVPFGKTPEENEIVRSGGTIPDLGNHKQPHWELTDKYKLIDFELGNKITGSGFPVYMGDGARLQRALIQYFLDYNGSAGYIEHSIPFMVNEASAYATGQLPDKEGQMYHATEDNFYLIPTSEVPLTNIFRDVLLQEHDLPLKLTAYSPCFRREAGSYGKDVRGLNRLHQFEKVEIVHLSHPAHSYEALNGMVQHVEQLLISLGLPYRILRLCGGDMSFTSALTFDFEVYSAAQERWLEVSSVSNFEVYQSNRLKVRFKDGQGKTNLVHTLNGSALALPRIMASLLENNQTADGINIPPVLHQYFGKERIA
jgi:seryl-tRNA synthetase